MRPHSASNHPSPSVTPSTARYEPIMYCSPVPGPLAGDPSLPALMSDGHMYVGTIAVRTKELAALSFVWVMTYCWYRAFCSTYGRMNTVHVGPLGVPQHGPL